MSLLRAYLIILVVLALAIVAGCQTTSNRRTADARAESRLRPLMTVHSHPTTPDYSSGLQAAWPMSGSPAEIQPPKGTHVLPAYHQQDVLPLPRVAQDSEEVLPAGPYLSREQFIADVLARNPSLQAMVAAWQAAAQRYPQSVALDDPILMGMIAPQSVGSDLTETAYAWQVNQKVPWFGKRSLKGAVAAADADAAFQDVQDSRLQVELIADVAYFDYFLAARLMELNRENTQLMEQFRQSAQAKFRTNAVTQQDVLQADLELADLQRRRLELDRIQQVAIARINTLLRRWPDAPLAPPPAKLDSPQQPADADLLWQTALRQRPDLAALAWKVQAEEGALALAYKNYCPDFDVFGRYDTFWQPASTQGPLRGQVGVAMNLPIYREKLRAAVGEAKFRVSQRRAEFDQRSLEIQYEVIAASRQVDESRKTVELYAQRVVPAAEQNVAAARTNYEVGKLNFLDLAQAQRQLILMREREFEAQAEYHRRLATLNRMVGGGGLVTEH